MTLIYLGDFSVHLQSHILHTSDNLAFRHPQECNCYIKFIKFCVFPFKPFIKMILKKFNRIDPSLSDAVAYLLSLYLNLPLILFSKFLVYFPPMI